MVVVVASAPAAQPLTIVACAPGYPGTTEQAQPAMDEFAAALNRSMKTSPDGLRAVYVRDLDPGLERLAADDVAVAMVPLPFYLQFREQLQLRPLARAVPTSGATERWSLVARVGALDGPSSLDGWVVTGMPGYAPGFVRDVALGAWGEIPDGTRIEFSSRVVSSLRKAAAGDNLAVLLDAAQTEALSTLPFANDLEIVARSGPLPATVVCSVGGRLAQADAERLVSSLIGLHETEGGPDALASMRMVRFEPLDAKALERAESAHAGAAD